MEVAWYGFENVKFDYYPEPDIVLLAKQKRGFKTLVTAVRSLLKMLSNTTTKEVCNAETGWEWYMEGKALFQVTLIPEKDTDRVAAELSEDILERLSMLHQMTNSSHLGKD